MNNVDEYNKDVKQQDYSECVEWFMSITNIDENLYSKMLETLEKITHEYEQKRQREKKHKTWLIRIFVKFIRNKLLGNYLLLKNILYNIKVKVLNKENFKKFLKYFIKLVGEIGLKEIIKMVIVKLINSIVNRRELNETSFCYV